MCPDGTTTPLCSYEPQYESLVLCDPFVTETLRKGRINIKLFNIAMGIIMGVVLGFVMAQFFDLLPAIIIGVIMGGSIAFGSSAMSTQKGHCGD